MTAMDDADAAAAKAVPFVNRDARRRILEAAAPVIAAAERERIRQLAIEHGAQYDIDVVGGLPFTDLIREEGTDVA